MRHLLLTAALLCSGPALAADLSLKLATASGAPVEHAVVEVFPDAGLPKGVTRFGWANEVVQRNIAFDPYVLIVPRGSDVSFPNFDKVRHHVYSFSAAKKFELKLYGREQQRSVHFDKAGTVAIGCNIHDRMQGFIRVVDTPYAAKSNASGQVRIAGLPEGGAAVRIWHPLLRGKGGETGLKLVVGAGKTERAITLQLRPATGS